MMEQQPKQLSPQVPGRETPSLPVLAPGDPLPETMLEEIDGGKGEGDDE